MFEDVGLDDAKICRCYKSNELRAKHFSCENVKSFVATVPSAARTSLCRTDVFALVGSTGTARKRCDLRQPEDSGAVGNVTRHQRQIITQRAARERLVHRADRVDAVSRFKAHTFACFDAAEPFPEALDTQISFNDTQSHPMRPRVAAPRFKPARNSLRRTASLMASRNDRQSDMPHAGREQIGDYVGHSVFEFVSSTNTRCSIFW